mmetsp:Transcript_95376/g.139277  ORF Transcript_95376/g.139277 Transcript_95376/m.139277 type:complete len:210 (-) Transcript_95376:90-719(-)
MDTREAYALCSSLGSRRKVPAPIRCSCLSKIGKTHSSKASESTGYFDMTDARVFKMSWMTSSATPVPRSDLRYFSRSELLGVHMTIISRKTCAETSAAAATLSCALFLSGPCTLSMVSNRSLRIWTNRNIALTAWCNVASAAIDAPGFLVVKEPPMTTRIHSMMDSAGPIEHASLSDSAAAAHTCRTLSCNTSSLLSAHARIALETAGK